MANTSKCSLNNMLQSVLSVALIEQNNVYPPNIFSSQFNVVTSLLISALVKSYPDSPQILDMLNPFVGFSMIPVSNGYFTLPDGYRNILGTPYIFINPEKNGECGHMPLITTASQFKTATLKAGCATAPIEIVPESEFSIRTSSTYKKPDHENPIGYFAANNTIKICPYDLTKVALLYVIQEDTYQYGYFQNPDDTYTFDTTTTTESQWTSAAFTPIFTAMCSLFSAYTRDNELRDWARILHNENIL